MAAAPSLSAIEQAIVAQAEANGVDPRLALSDAQQESGLNPTAVGDQGTSFGLFQLHEGGELGSLSPTQAFNPSTNASVALSVMGQVIQANPNISDPGTIAAMAERPADQASYAKSVDAIYNNPADFPQIPAGASTATLDKIDWSNVAGAVGQAAGGLLGPGVGIAGQAAGTAAGAAANALIGGFTSSFGKDVLKIVLDGIFTAAALGMILLGLTRLFPGITSNVRSVLPSALAAFA